MLEFGGDVSDEPERDPIKFGLTGYSLSKGKNVREEFLARGEVPTAWLNIGRVVDNGANIVWTGPDMRDFILKVLLDDDVVLDNKGAIKVASSRGRFAAFVENPDIRTEAKVIQSIWEGLQAAYFDEGNPEEVPARPTTSAAGSTPRRSRSGGTTTARRSSKGSTSPGSLAAVR